VAARGADLATTLLNECAAIAAHQGFTPSADFIQRNRVVFSAAGSILTASMLREIERRAPIEADQYHWRSPAAQ
jgi:2-dehydropantoate 2-reductase